MVNPRVLPMGERAFLLEVGSLAEVLALHAGLEASRPAGVTDLVPAARTVLVRVDPRVLPLAQARAWASAAGGTPTSHERTAPEIDLEVAYDGADLHDTARFLGVAVDELVARHSTAAWTVAFTGFAPGFGYLVSPDWPYDIPRLASPRTRVPAGAVGVAGEFTGAYPRETPGGWRLLGTTVAPLWRADAATPALLVPGARVRIRPVDARRPPHRSAPPSSSTPAVDPNPPSAVRPSPPAPSSTPPTGCSDPATTVDSTPPAAPPAHPPQTPAVEVVEPGLLATVQDLGRPGAAHLGVARSGALDRAALRTANRLLGNAESAAGIEVTMGGFRAVARRDLWIATTGAWGPVRIDGRPVDPYAAHPWPAGAELHLDWFAHGARACIAVRGGLAAPAVLGSRSTDLLAGLGLGALRAGDVLGLAGAAASPIPVAEVAPWSPPHDDEIEIELAPGPRADWFAASARAALFETVWILSNQADRVGARLDGPALERVHEGELPSEGMVPGALQVPPSGRPTILLADGPVTGGYPVIALVTDAALDAVAQARPGTRIRFRHARPPA